MKNSNKGSVAVTITAGSYAENCVPAANEACVGNFHSSRQFLSNYSLIIIHYSLIYLTKETTQQSTADFQ